MRNSKGKKLLLFILIPIVLSVAAFLIYTGDYYRADNEAIAAFASADSVTVETIGSDAIAYIPKEASAGFIFYPGGKVEYTAYAPLMRRIAQEGVQCCLVEMPFNLAVFDVNAAGDIIAKYPEIDTWYIGGHSLGGAMAASYAAENADELKGLVLLGAYSASDLSESGIEVLSVYGTEDKVLNFEKYSEYKPNLPEGFTETVISGGCHSYFGVYGNQSGDGVPSVSNAEQIEITAKAILDFIA